MTTRTAPPRPADTRRGRRLGWARLLPESVRGLLSVLPGVVAVVAGALLVDALREETFEVTEMIFVGVAAYLITYLALTLTAFRRARWSQVEGWAQRRTRPHWSIRLLTASEPGPGVATGVSALALAVAVVWMPTQRGGTGIFSTGQQLLLTAVLIATAWLTVAVTYAVAYLVQDVRSGEMSLSFPGEGPRRFLDYVYFSLAVSSTFGTTDVEVLTTRARRLVAAHSVTAFVFNTVILGAVVSTLVSTR